MPRRIRLTDFQRALSERLAQAAQRELDRNLRLAVVTGDARWLVRMDEVGEVLFVPPLYAVPAAKPWFRGLANLRGHLLGVVDWSQLEGGARTDVDYRCRLLMLSPRLGVAAALLVGAVAGLRSIATLHAQAREAADASWIAGRHIDAETRIWREADLSALSHAREFLHIEDRIAA